jgi:hypothetical protein
MPHAPRHLARILSVPLPRLCPCQNCASAKITTSTKNVLLPRLYLCQNVPVPRLCPCQNRTRAMPMPRFCPCQKHANANIGPVLRPCLVSRLCLSQYHAPLSRSRLCHARSCTFAEILPVPNLTDCVHAKTVPQQRSDLATIVPLSGPSLSPVNKALVLPR